MTTHRFYSIWSYHMEVKGQLIFCYASLKSTKKKSHCACLHTSIFYLLFLKKFWHSKEMSPDWDVSPGTGGNLSCSNTPDSNQWLVIRLQQSLITSWHIFIIHPIWMQRMIPGWLVLVYAGSHEEEYLMQLLLDCTFSGGQYFLQSSDVCLKLFLAFLSSLYTWCHQNIPSVLLTPSC